MRKFLLVLALGPALAAAALEVNLLELDLAVVPGQVYPVSFIVRNETAVAEMFSVYLGDWDRDATGENRFYPPGTLPRSLASWLTVAPTSFSLGPGEVREITGTLRVPVGAEVGTHWAIVFVQGEPQPMEYQGTTVMVAKRIGIKIYATVGSPLTAGEVRDLSFRGLNPLWLVVEFANVGLVNLRAVRVGVEIYDATGDVVARAEPDPVPCLPGGVRRVVVATEVRPCPGTYLVVARVDPGGEEVLAAQAYLRVRPLYLVPIGGASVPRDLDGDGLYEDIDGNGVFDEQDVQLFARSWMTPAVQGNWWAFDFDNSGHVDEADVDALAVLLARDR